MLGTCVEKQKTGHELLRSAYKRYFNVTVGLPPKSAVFAQPGHAIGSNKNKRATNPFD